MHIGLIIHSQTGHTLAVAEKLVSVLEKAGHTVTFTHLKSEKASDGKATQPLVFPSLDTYDGIVFGSHVEAFQLALPMKEALDRMGPLNGKIIGCLVTQQLKKPWLGGSWASMKMSKICTLKGGQVKAVTSVQWSSSERESLIENALGELEKAFS